MASDPQHKSWLNRPFDFGILWKWLPLYWYVPVVIIPAFIVVLNYIPRKLNPRYTVAVVTHIEFRGDEKYYYVVNDKTYTRIYRWRRSSRLADGFYYIEYEADDPSNHELMADRSLIVCIASMAEVPAQGWEVLPDCSTSSSGSESSKH
jgi:hypothetical protein